MLNASTLNESTPFDPDMLARRGWATVRVPPGDVPAQVVRDHDGQRIEVTCIDFGLAGEAWAGQYRWAPLVPLRYKFEWLPDAYLKFDVTPERPRRFP